VTRRAWLAAAALAAAVALAACGAPKPVATEAELAEAKKLRVQALIDSGSAAYRNQDFTVAAKRFAAAAVVDPQDPAAFYGLGMALSKLGRDDEARVAYARSRELSRGEIDNETMPREVRYRRTRHP
jgi:Flp pilus assembly protein TadD